jgi:hypothetical protein
MKKNYYFAIAFIASLGLACSSTKPTTTTTTANSDTKTPEKEVVMDRPNKIEEPPAPVVESLSQGKKGNGVSVQPSEESLIIEEEKLSPVPEVIIPPLSKEEQERYKQLIEVAKKKKKG